MAMLLDITTSSSGGVTLAGGISLLLIEELLSELSGLLEVLSSSLEELSEDSVLGSVEEPLSDVVGEITLTFGVTVLFSLAEHPPKAAATAIKMLA